MFSLLISTSSFGETAKFGWKDGEWTNGKWSAKSWKPILYGINVYIDKSSFKSFENKFNNNIMYFTISNVFFKFLVSILNINFSI